MWLSIHPRCQRMNLNANYNLVLIAFLIDMNKLCINKKKSSVMIIGSKFQLRSLNLDDFAISVNADKLQLVEQAKYLGLWVQNDLSWDDHILELCRKMYYYVHMFRRLRKILPSQLGPSTIARNTALARGRRAKQPEVGTKLPWWLAAHCWLHCIFGHSQHF